MSASRRHLILAALVERLSAIKTNDGFLTDAGYAILLNEAPVFGEDDMPVAIALMTQDDEVRHQGENVVVLLPIEIQAVAKGDINMAWLAVEQVLADIKRAVELPDRTLGKLVPRQIERGSTRTLPREQGSTTVGAAITYRALYAEAWGNP